MGGGAIKHPTTGIPITGRLPAAVYVAVKAFVQATLRQLGVHAETVLELPGKQTFGDLDMLYVKSPEVKDMKALVVAAFRLQQPWHVVNNGTVMSCAVDYRSFLADDFSSDASLPPYFQIDFIRTQSVSHLEASRFYFSYGDVGSILGRLVNHYALKIGDDGLWCDLLEHTVDPASTKFDVRHTVGKLMLSSDAVRICEFLKLDFHFWDKVIPTLAPGDYRPIFDWIMTCPLADPRIFGSLNSDHRARFNKRPFYRQFVEYLGIQHIAHATNVAHSETGGPDFNLQPKAIEFFGQQAAVAQLYAECLIRRSRHEKFKGSDVIGKYEQLHGTPCKGKTAGSVIHRFQVWCLARTASDRLPETVSPSEDPQQMFAHEWQTFLDGVNSRDEILALMDTFLVATAE